MTKRATVDDEKNTINDTKRQKAEDKLNFVQIDVDAYRASFNLISSSPLLRSVITYFCNSCMSNELSVFSADHQEIPLSPDLRDMVATHLIPVAMRAIRWILVTGIVPVSFENITHDMCIPVIPDPDAVTVSCARSNTGFRMVYRVSEVGSTEDGGTAASHAPVDSIFPNIATGKPNANRGKNIADSAVSLFVLSEFSVPPPTHKGKLQSPFQTALSVVGELNVLNAQRNQAMQCLINPPIVTELSDSNKDEVNRGLSFEVVGGTNVLYNAQAAAVEHAKVYAREHPEALLGLDSAHLGDHGDLTDFVNSALHNSVERRATCITLPTNHKLVKQHLPIVPPDYLATVKMYEEKICALFGLPLGVVMGYVGSHRTSALRNGSSASNATEMHIAQIAVSRMRLDLEVFLTRILKVACYKNHYARKRSEQKEHANVSHAEKTDAHGQDDDTERAVLHELGIHDLLPPGAYCKLRSMESVTRSDEQHILNEEVAIQMRRDDKHDEGETPQPEKGDKEAAPASK